jgi:hypothetical protein
MPASVFLGYLDRQIRSGNTDVDLLELQLTGQVAVRLAPQPAPLYGAYALTKQGVSDLITILNAQARLSRPRRPSSRL